MSTDQWERANYREQYLECCSLCTHSSGYEDGIFCLRTERTFEVDPTGICEFFECSNWHKHLMDIDKSQ